MTVAEAMKKMILLSNGNRHDINHFLKVHAYAAAIGACEGLPEDTLQTLELAAIVTHVADARTCVLHPASHTHRQMNDEQLREAGVNPDLIRFSVGIENADDIIADLEQALAAI